MLAAAGRNLTKLAARVPKRALPTRGGPGGPDPNAPKWEQAVRTALPQDEHVVFAVIGIWTAVIWGASRALKK